MQRLILLLLAFMTLGSVLPAQRILLEKSFPESWINDAIVVEDGYLVLGHRERSYVENNRYHHVRTPFVAKLDGDFKPVWEEQFKAGQHRSFKSLAPAEDGFYAISTYYGPNNKDKGKAWLIKCDSRGKKQWEKFFHYQNYNSTEGKNLRTLPDGSLLVMTRTYRNYNSYGSQWLHRLDKNGDLIWEFMMGKDKYYSGLANIDVNPDGTVVMTGFSYENRAQFTDETNDGWIYQFHPDSPGSPLLSKSYSGYQKLILGHTLPLESGGWWVVGRYRTSAKNNYVGILMELDANGNLLDKHTWDLENGLVPVDLCYNYERNTLLLAGWTCTATSRTDYLLHYFEVDQDFRRIDKTTGGEGRYSRLIPFSNGEVLTVSTGGLQLLR